MPRFQTVCVLACLVGFFTPRDSHAQFDLVLSITNPGIFNSQQLTLLDEAIEEAERVWEGIIVGYQPGITQTTLPITVTGSFATGLADASGVRSPSRVGEGQFFINTRGSIRINPGQIVPFSAFAAFNADNSEANLLDNLIAHEIAHVLGIGPRWIDNGLYQFNSGRYTGEFGLAEYRREFDPDAEFIPVELAGPAGSRNVHWDQLFRSSPEEGNPDDPFSLSPALGITDRQGRDLGFELLTAAIDPDFGEPFLANFTIQSLRDIGFVVVPEPASGGLALIAFAIASGGRRRGH